MESRTNEELLRKETDSEWHQLPWRGEFTLPWELPRGDLPLGNEKTSQIIGP
jgi:hypothetical protein